MTSLDDILIYSKSEDEHLNHLDIASRILRNNKIHAKTFKCQFHKTHVEYLGHLMSGEGISVNPKKIKAINNWESRNKR